MSYFIGRLLKSRMLWIALCMMLVIIFAQYISIFITTKGYNSAHNIQVSPYLSNILYFNNVQFYSEIYLVIFPIISTIALAGIYRMDRNYGFLFSAVAKMGTQRYFRILYFINFIVSFLIIVIPLLLNFYLYLMTYPAISPHPIVNYMSATISPTAQFNGVYYNHPNLYFLMYIIMNGLYGAIFSSVALSISFFVKRVYFVYVVPFILHIVWLAAGKTDINPKEYLIKNMGFFELQNFLSVLIVIWILSICVYFWGSKKHVLL